MRSVVDRLKNVLTFSEIKAVSVVAKELDGKAEIAVVMSNISDKLNISRSVAKTSLRLLEVSGVIETASIDSKGTYVKVLNSEVLKEIANM